MTSLRRSATAGPAPVVTALIYTRVSSDDQAREGTSLDAQLAECRRYAARFGWLLGTEYQDVLSGMVDARPQYQQLLADVRSLRAQGTILVVVVAALDRFGRRLMERLRCREELRALGVPVHSVREGGEVSDLVANVLGAVAQEEVRRLGERIKAARRYVYDRGFMPQGRVPWGYRWRPAIAEERAAGAPLSVLDIDDESAEYVHELFQRVADGETIRKAARWVYALPSSARSG
jgi:site-specific DNA recombinase